MHDFRHSPKLKILIVQCNARDRYRVMSLVKLFTEAQAHGQEYLSSWMATDIVHQLQRVDCAKLQPFGDRAVNLYVLKNLDVVHSHDDGNDTHVVHNGW